MFSNKSREIVRIFENSCGRVRDCDWHAGATADCGLLCPWQQELGACFRHAFATDS
jgi:hypothetical protein